VRPGLGRDIQQVEVLSGKIIAKSSASSFGVLLILLNRGA